MTFDYCKLRGKIKEVFRTQELFANAMAMHGATLSLKLNNKTPFTQDEIIHAANALHIASDDIPAYFFTPKVEKTQLDKKGVMM